MCAIDILTCLEIGIIIVSIILLCVNGSKSANVLTAIVFIVQLLIFGFLIFGLSYLRTNSSGPHCSEAYACEPSSKKGFVECKYLDYDNKEKKVTCPEPEKISTTTTTTRKKVTTTRMENSV